MKIFKKTHSERSSCAYACMLDIIGDRWSMIILRDMIFKGSHEFKEFIAMQEKISTNILADRLKKLVSYNIIGCIIHPKDHKRKLYYLTEAGKNFIHPMVEMGIWAEKYLNYANQNNNFTAAIINDKFAFKSKILSSLEQWEKENL